ncbi:MAG: neutral/alkaline non-lysosomal ceramidase N-terminal domain-containing protein [Mariniphaga sp.]|nr:neutral/alkaline non-lysosomal ceramidase N-terminal domain-containing protein [Mariniphaga sp.]
MKRKGLVFKTIFILILCTLEVFSNNPVLKAGISKVDMTPTASVFMGGYDETCRTGPSDGVYGKIYIRSLVFDDGIRRLAIIVADIVDIPGERNQAIRDLIAAETDIPVQHILLGSAHNHAAPSLDSRNSESDWYQSFDNNVVKAVKAAIADLEPVKTGGGTGISHIGMNRRKRMEETVSYLTFDENNSSQSYGKYNTNTPVKIREMDGVYRLGANPEGSIDEEVGIMRIDKLSGEPKAVLVNYACHGTSLGGRNNTISPEWHGHMLEHIEKTMPGITGIFLPGAGGDINPRFVGGLDGYEDNLENTANLGYEIGKEVIRVLSGIHTTLPVNPAIKIVHEDITCPLKYDRVIRDFRTTTNDVPVTAVRIDDFVWVTFPGELFHEIGKKVKSATHARYPFLAGYCNGAMGYLPTQQAYSEGGYEPWTSRFAPVTEKIFLKETEKMLLKLY